MHIHILGISGTFMSALALLAREMGYEVSGCDANCYPPVSDLLTEKGINWIEGYDDAQIALKADVVVVGNAIKRGLPVMEAVIEAGKPYISGPQWLAEHVLKNYQVIAISGTHGKTTTTSMIAFILDCAGLNPGFLIGGVSSDFQTSAQLGQGKWFVIEADEYDSAFFDKRPKFMHYRPRIAILNNLEFDHADIYPNLDAIKLQFHYFLRTIPASGMVLKPLRDPSLNEVFEKGVYSQVEQLAINEDADWSAKIISENADEFIVLYKGEEVAHVNWNLIGQFNVENGLAALAASVNAGVDPKDAAAALARFKPVKRRLEVKSTARDITVYDDFAHHPTAIKRTIDALNKSKRHQRVFAVLEFASYTMRTGVHGAKIASALLGFDKVFILKPQDFDLEQVAENWSFSYKICENIDEIVEQIANTVQPGDGVLVMSNRGFAGIHQRLITAIKQLS